jgi:hypothetical protein
VAKIGDRVRCSAMSRWSSESPRTILCVSFNRWSMRLWPSCRLAFRSCTPESAGLRLPGEAVARFGAAGAIHDPQRASVDGATRLQPSVPLVCGPGDGRSCVGPHGLHQEPGPSVGRGRWQRLSSHSCPIAQPQTRGSRYRQWTLVSLDGSTLDLADTAENETAFGRPVAARGQAPCAGRTPRWPATTNW